MLPKNLLSFIALHAPTIIHATLAMTRSHQLMEGSEDIKLIIRGNIGWLEKGQESIYWEVQNKLKQIDSHLTKNIRAKIIQLDGKHPEAEPIAFWGVVGKKENNLLAVEHTHADLGEVHFQSKKIKTFGTVAYKEEWVSTNDVQSSPAHGKFPEILLAVENWNTEKLVNIWNDLQRKMNNWKIDSEEYDNINWNDLPKKINNWKVDSEKYDNLNNMFVSIRCVFLLANLIERYQLIPPSFMVRIDTFKPDTVFKMAMLNIELKSKLPIGKSFGRVGPLWSFNIWNKNPVESYLQPFIKGEIEFFQPTPESELDNYSLCGKFLINKKITLRAVLPRSQQKMITFLFLKEYIESFKAECKTGLENYSFILEESSYDHSLARLDNLSSEISSGIKTRQEYRELDLFYKMKNCFESFDKNQSITNELFLFITGRFTINYHVINFIKNFYKNIFDKLEPVDHEGNSLLFQAKMKLVEDYLIYTQDNVGDQNLKRLSKHHDSRFSENKPGGAPYFDWSNPLVLSLLKL
ncbi:hypothetical protein PSHT_10662 [Puccinia striiformis]|uniref:Uncharacterized protein n=2 Tax=Puccinia striiformis TaxID=27350 RepID=A0A2S4V877_9BASI